jgi:AcrR family transcriptional regulator
VATSQVAKKKSAQRRTDTPAHAKAAAVPAPVAPARRSPGRARSDVARVAILNAALKLLETLPLQQITIEAIAREAEVGKATIYRWWPSKASIVIDAFVQNHIAHTPMLTGTSAREALDRHLHLLIEQYGGWPGRLVAQILAEGQSDPVVLREFRERFAYGRRAVVREVIDEGRRRGEFRTDMDPEMQADLLYAPIYQRLMMQHLPLDKAFADTLTSTVLKLLAPDEVRVAAAKKAPSRTRRTA